MPHSINNVTAIHSDTIESAPSDSPNASTVDPYVDLSILLKAAADPLRLEILRVLSKGSYGVMELAFLFDLKQSAMSHHLKVLAKAKLVTTRREGNSIFYRRNELFVDVLSQHSDKEDSQIHFLSPLFKTLDALPLQPKTKQRLGNIQQERATASQEFFSANANKFREQQDLIASFSIYGDHVKNLLHHIQFSDKYIALEIGPGEGEFLSVLAENFKRVIALDNSIDMLNKAKQLVNNQQLNDVEFILGDTRSAISQGIIADCIIINMVLHHVPSPEELFQDAAALLNQNGSLIVTDLCRHNQQWATESCGDLWLGFDPSEFSTWAKAAKLKEGQSQFFALRNGFQIQLRHFIKGES
ncbi:MAG: metalloregulator ArsR/SmtB family transcription factor [Cellvibrionaceae bacterium]